MSYTNKYVFIKTIKETPYPKSQEESFYYFIKNSRIELVSDSSAYSLVFKCKFCKSAKLSPYFSLDTQKDETQIDVTEIIIKVLLLCDDNALPEKIDDETVIHWNYITTENKKEIRHYDLKLNFFDETNRQLEIAEKSIQIINRNTPVLLFSKLYTYKSSNYKLLARTIYNNCINNVHKHALNQMLDMFYINSTLPVVPGNENQFYFGVIGMEYIMPKYKVHCSIIRPIIYDQIKSIPENANIHKYDSVSLSKHSDRLKWMYNTARYELLRLAVDVGYSQGDYHTENLLIDEIDRKVIIIDFGKAVIIPTYSKIYILWQELICNNFKDNYKNYKNIKQILQYIFDSTHEEDNKHSAEYKWLKNIDEEDVNIIIILHRMRVIKIENYTIDKLKPFLCKPYLYESCSHVDSHYSYLQWVCNYLSYYI